MKNFKAHILVVDDDDGIRNLVKQYLSQNDFLVTTAKNSEDAQKKTKIVKFDLIVLDIMMPGKTGLEFTHENKRKIDTPILLLTAKGEASERIEGLEVGADDYLSKPFEPKELILRIKNILNKTKLKVSKRVIEFGSIKIDLKYHNGTPVIRKIKRISKPGIRVYSKIKLLPKPYGGLGISIISTPKGVMSDKKARDNNVGGEVLCEVF